MVKEGMLFLSFHGMCDAALGFYQTVFDAQIVEKITYGEAEMAESPDINDWIMNSTIKIGNFTICAYDVLEDELKDGNRISVWLEIDTEESIRLIYERFLQSDCNIITKLETTFWNSLYAKVQDPFGFVWELNCQAKDT